mmetsp:Transcript_60912/g.113922  ORF Transcript_60912/g.113922 Transcript_60912/m.113922 type:complete len:304 (-) Transcript_60912:64-975(-)
MAEPSERSALRQRVQGYKVKEELSSSAWLLSKEAEQEEVVVAVEIPVITGEGAVEAVLENVLSPESATATFFNNDRFYKQTGKHAADVCVEVICPATKKDIDKRRKVVLHRCLETRALYDSITVPSTIQGAEKRDTWVANIILGKSEQEFVVPELSGDGLTVVKDYKWQKVEVVDDLYYLCLFTDMSVRSLRDLREQHVPLLERVETNVVPGLAKKHGVDPSSLLAYVHYQPTFWYFHVHIVNCRHAMFSGEKGGENLLLTALDRFHKVDAILALLKARGDYFANATLPVLLPAWKAEQYKSK